MIKHPANAKPQSAKHPMEDEVELFEEAEITPGELDEVDLIEELEDEGLEEEELLADEEFGDEDADEVPLEEADEEVVVAAPARRAEEDGDDEDAADVDEADVEPTLDEILRERVGVDEDQAVEEDEDEARTEPLRAEDLENAVLPPQSWEFVCSSCFLVKNRTQLVDAAKHLCRDCAE